MLGIRLSYKVTCEIQIYIDCHSMSKTVYEQVLLLGNIIRKRKRKKKHPPVLYRIHIRVRTTAVNIDLKY